MRKLVVIAAIAGLMLAISAEALARFVLGLGDPPVSESLPDVEYVLVHRGFLWVAP